jgi:hypothetical protein
MEESDDYSIFISFVCLHSILLTLPLKAERHLQVTDKLTIITYSVTTVIIHPVNNKQHKYLTDNHQNQPVIITIIS